MRRPWVIVMAPLGIAAVLALGGWVVQQLWNWLLPAIFGWPALTFWQALGLLALCRILFGGSAGRGWSRGGWHGGGARWEALTPEERETIRRRMRARWGLGPAGGDGGER
jgi:hypothetical protein